MVFASDIFEFEDGKDNFRFRIHRVEGDGSCAYEAMNTSREEVQKHLLENIHDDKVRELIGPEIQTLFETKELPLAMQNDPKYQKLYNKWAKAENAENLDKIENEIAEYCRNEDVVTNFINEYIAVDPREYMKENNNNKNWMNITNNITQPSLTSTADAIAYLTNTNLLIFHQNGSEKKLLHFYNAPKYTHKFYYLLHTGKFNDGHFDKLELDSSNKATQSNHNPTSGSAQEGKNRDVSIFMEEELNLVQKKWDILNKKSMINLQGCCLFTRPGIRFFTWGFTSAAASLTGAAALLEDATIKSNITWAAFGCATAAAIFKGFDDYVQQNILTEIKSAAAKASSDLAVHHTQLTNVKHNLERMASKLSKAPANTMRSEAIDNQNAEVNVLPDVANLLSQTEQHLNDNIDNQEKLNYVLEKHKKI